MTRLADVTRPAGQAFFTPIMRPRIVQRIGEAAAGRIVLIVAPAGYGKSLALSQWLEQQPATYLRFDVQHDHATLLGFVRGFAEACSPASPALSKTVATAWQSSAPAVSPGDEMARWMAANLESFDGQIAIDDFHRAADDPEISRFLSSLISRTKSRIQWVIATRSTLDLPVASWFGYGDVHFVLGERDLTFSESETEELSQRLGEPLSRDGAREALEATAGWPVALGFALRSSALFDGGKPLASATRDILFNYLAEQVYADLTCEERELLHFASYLPAIQGETLEAAGYADWARILEGVRRRVTFLSLDVPGVYKCHDLFHEFLQRQIETSDPAAVRDMRAKAASTLERLGNQAGALRLYAGLKAAGDILRLLCASGFDMMDRSHGDVVEAAIGILPPDVRATNAVILGLRAQREADLGHFARAETLFEKALSQNPAVDTHIRLALRLAVLLRNQSRRITELLLPLSEIVDAESRAEVRALLAVDAALSFEKVETAAWMSAAESSLDRIENNDKRARVLLRLGIARMSLGAPADDIMRNFSDSAKLSERDGLLGVAARALTGFATAQLFYLNDFDAALNSLTKASVIAAKSGDRIALHSALAYLLTVETHLGNVAEIETLLRRLNDAATSDTQRHRTIVSYTRATLAAWKGRFPEAADLMREVSAAGYGYYDFDQLFNMASHALYSRAAGRTVEQTLSVNLRVGLRKDASSMHEYGRQKRCLAVLLYALAECWTGESEQARQLLEENRTCFVGPMKVFMASVESIVDRSLVGQDPFSAGCSAMRGLGHDGPARTIEMCSSSLLSVQFEQGHQSVNLTSAERQILAALDAGYRTKEIALETERSLHTVRTLIQRAIHKLGCHGRQEAVVLAKRLGLLDSA